MNRSEFCDAMRNKDYLSITGEDCSNFLNLFGNIDWSYVEKMLGIQSVRNLGKAMRLYWASAETQFFTMGRNNVEVFKGMYLVSNKNPNNPIRMKYAKLIPDKTPPDKCMELVESFTGLIGTNIEPIKQIMEGDELWEKV